MDRCPHGARGRGLRQRAGIACGRRWHAVLRGRGRRRCREPLRPRAGRGVAAGAGHGRAAGAAGRVRGGRHGGPPRRMAREPVLRARPTRVQPPSGSDRGAWCGGGGGRRMRRAGRRDPRNERGRAGRGRGPAGGDADAAPER